MDLGLYDSKQNNQLEKDDMSNYCPSIQMPADRRESARRPYDVPVREASTIDINFQRTAQDRVDAFVAIGRSMNILGKTFQLKQKYSYASWALERATIKYEIVEDETSVSQLITH